MFNLATSANKERLPQVPAIFFLSNRGKLLYIGATDNLALRLKLPFPFEYKLVHWLRWNDRKVYLELRKTFQPPHNDGFKDSDAQPYHIWKTLDETQPIVVRHLRSKIEKLSKQADSPNIDVAMPAIEEIIDLLNLAPIRFESEILYWRRVQRNTMYAHCQVLIHAYSC